MTVDLRSANPKLAGNRPVGDAGSDFVRTVSNPKWCRSRTVTWWRPAFPWAEKWRYPSRTLRNRIPPESPAMH